MQKPQPSHELPPKQVEETQETLCQGQVQLQAQAKHAGTQGLGPSFQTHHSRPFHGHQQAQQGQVQSQHVHGYFLKNFNLIKIEDKEESILENHLN